MHQNHPSRAFTLIEIMVVIAIIAILASISLVVASKVTQGGRERVTADIIKALDTSAQSYISQAGKFPTKYTDLQDNEFLIIDARGNKDGLVQTGFADASNPPEPSLALFTLAASKYTSIEDALKSFDSKFIKREAVFSPTMGISVFANKQGFQAATALNVYDPWGNPIRFVHPAFHGGYGAGHQLQPDGTYTQVVHGSEHSEILALSGASKTVSFRRSAKPSLVAGTVGDADEGICPGAMPYFYSPGADKDPGTREDNVYTTKPTYPTVTRAKQ